MMEITLFLTLMAIFLPFLSGFESVGNGLSSSLQLSKASKFAENDVTVRYADITYHPFIESKIHTIDISNTQAERKKPDNFTLNLGKAMDTISVDIPNMFIAEPHLEILTDDIVLKDPRGVLAKGKHMYSAVFASVRLMSRLSGSKSDVQMISLSFDPADYLIEARVRMDTYSFFQSHVRLDTISRYKVNSEGLIFEHDFDMHIRDKILGRAPQTCRGGGILSM